MKGLITKDLLILKNNAKSLVLLVLIYIVCSINADGVESFIIPFMMAMLCVSTFNYDEYNKWDAFAITLPGTRKNVVRAKYVVGLLLMFASLVVSLLLSFILGTMKRNLDFSSTLEYTLSGLAAGILVISFMFPLILKFGLEKGRIGIMIASFGLSALIVTFASVVRVPTGVISFLETNLIAILPIITLLILSISYVLSVKIYEKKEF